MTRQAKKATLENRLDTIMKKAKPAPTQIQTAGLEMAPNRSRSLPLLLAFLTVLLLFSVTQIQPQPPTITGPIAAITVTRDSAIQTADLIDTNEPMTVIHAQPGFHCYAGCSFFKPITPLDSKTAQNEQSI